MMDSRREPEDLEGDGGALGVSEDMLDEVLVEVELENSCGG